MTTLRPVVALLVLLFAQAKPTGTLVVRVAYWKDAKFAVAAEEKVIAIEVK